MKNAGMFDTNLGKTHTRNIKTSKVQILSHKKNHRFIYVAFTNSFTYKHERLKK